MGESDGSKAASAATAPGPGPRWRWPSVFEEPSAVRRPGAGASVGSLAKNGADGAADTSSYLSIEFY